MKTLAASVRAMSPPAAVQRAQRIFDAGFEKLVLDEPMYFSSWEALREMLPRESVAALRLFVPYPRSVLPGFPLPFRLAATDRDERLEARRHAEASLEAADGLRVPLVLLPVEEIEIPGPPPPPLGVQAPKELHDDAEARRRLAARPGLDALFIQLARLLERALRYELKLCLTPSMRRQDLVRMPELDACLREFSGAPLAVWLDCAVLPADALEAGPRPEPAGSEGRAGPEQWGGVPIAGASVHDVRGESRGFPPPSGELNWTRLEKLLVPLPLLALDLRPEAPPEELASGLEFLSGLGAEPRRPGASILLP
jgi:hypothetical protein